MAARKVYFEYKADAGGTAYTYRNNYGTRMIDTTSVPKQPIGRESPKIFLIFQNGKAVDYGSNYDHAVAIARRTAEGRAREFARRTRATLEDRTPMGQAAVTPKTS